MSGFASSIAFTRRPDGWHDDRPYIDRIVYRVITDETARAADPVPARPRVGGWVPNPAADI